MNFTCANTVSRTSVLSVNHGQNRGDGPCDRQRVCRSRVRLAADATMGALGVTGASELSADCTEAER